MLANDSVNRTARLTSILKTHRSRFRFNALFCLSCCGKFPKKTFLILYLLY